MINERIFREYDIRGIVGRDMNKDTAVCLGRAFGSLVRMKNPAAKYVSVGRDVRLSFESLASGIIEGILSTGVGVYDVGVCPTPAQYFSLFHLGLDGGVMVTGSHNPPEYNGFKLSIGKDTIHGRDVQVLKEIIQRQEWITSTKEGRFACYDISAAYIEYLLKEFAYLKGGSFKRLTVVVDAGNGTAGLIAPRVLKKIGCEVIPLFCEPDGNFPNHHPDPTVVEYMEDLRVATKRAHADVGIGYDGDADRIGIVNRDGDIIWGDQLMIVLSREVLKRNPGAKVIGDVKCSEMMFDDVRKQGGIPIMWKTGHSLIKQKMRDEGALIAGEFSGHIFMGDRYFGYDDAIYATLRLIEIMKTTGKNVSELLSDVPKMCSTPEIRIECHEDNKKEIVEAVVAKFQKYRGNGGSPYRIRELSMIDGVRILLDGG